MKTDKKRIKEKKTLKKFEKKTILKGKNVVKNIKKPEGVFEV